MLPMFESLFADIVATLARVLSVTGLLIFLRPLTICSVPFTSSLRTDVLLCLSVIISSPLRTKALDNTIAVVVPSPADIAVFSAASFTILTAKFSTGSSKLIDLATVTPSLVTVIPDKCSSDSISTV